MNDHLLDGIYAAISDPTRRAILARLARGDAKVGQIADAFPISLNSVSKHIKVLEKAGLIERRIEGRDHRLSLRAEPLEQASRWLDHYEAFWNQRIDTLENMLVARKRLRPDPKESKP